jgi:hypothetical protein
VFFTIKNDLVNSKNFAYQTIWITAC